MRRALLLLALLVLVAGCGGSEGGGDEAGAAEAGSFAVLDRVVLPTRPGGIAAGTDAVWATNPEAGELVKVDTTTGEVAGTYKVAQAATGVTAGGGSVWVVDPLASEIVRVDEATGEPVAHIPLANPAEIAFGFGSLWAVEGVGVTRIDAATNRVVARVAMPGSVTALTVGGDAVWVVGRSRGFGRDGGWDLARIDPETNRRSAEIELGEFVGANWVATTPGRDVGVGELARPLRPGADRLPHQPRARARAALADAVPVPRAHRGGRPCGLVRLGPLGREDRSTHEPAHGERPRQQLRAPAGGAPRLRRSGRRRGARRRPLGRRSGGTCDRSGREGLLTHGQRRRD